MKNAVWVSRHELTPEQREEIVALGYSLFEEEKGILLGGRNLVTDEDVVMFMSDLHDYVREGKAGIVLGVFAVPVQAGIMEETCQICDRIGQGYVTPSVPCYSAWNVNRTVDGGKPTFEHRGFKLVGMISA
jgi:hypothetical protein